MLAIRCCARFATSGRLYVLRWARAEGLLPGNEVGVRVKPIETTSRHAAKYSLERCSESAKFMHDPAVKAAAAAAAAAPAADAAVAVLSGSAVGPGTATSSGHVELFPPPAGKGGVLMGGGAGTATSAASATAPSGDRSSPAAAADVTVTTSPTPGSVLPGGGGLDLREDAGETELFAMKETKEAKKARMAAKKKERKRRAANKAAAAASVDPGLDNGANSSPTVVPDPPSMDPNLDVVNDAKLLAEESANRALLDELAALRVRQRKLVQQAAAV